MPNFDPADPWAIPCAMTDLINSLSALRADAAQIGNDTLLAGIDMALDEARDELDRATKRAAEQDGRDMAAMEREYRLAAL